ncbi:MAG: aminotransferase class I/II-fold pyridoxal phosphate-dependent enzyme, partial [Muribaculaceae bacterium]|nr:aminotransferase class I/II-fold pyridoxal phosphate-dependent enzyme [Muribaculaceae bacterium]
MDFISERINNLTPSATLAMSQKSAELRAAGIDVINMSIGEPDFNTPDFIKEAAKVAIDENYTHYPPVPGYMTLRKAISEKLSRENGVDYAPEQIVVGNGAKQELCNALLATVNPGDEVIIPVPAWVSYMDMVKLAEGKVVPVYAGVEQNFKITPEQLEAAITPRSRVVMFNSPSNPTGSVYSRAELAALAAVLERHPHVLILADDIYEHINYVGGAPSIAQFESLRDRM